MTKSIGGEQETVLICSYPNAELMLKALLNGCVKDKSAHELLERDLAKPLTKQEKGIKKTFERSLGNGHNAAGDLIPYTFSMSGVPRLETLRIARYPHGFSLMQQSTRRVEHQTVAMPNSIASNSTARELFESTIEGIMKDYRTVLEFVEQKEGEEGRIGIRQDAMIFTPLLLRTNIGFTANARGLWHYIVEGERENAPEVVKRSSEEVKRQLLERHPQIFREWKNNYGVHEFFPTGSDFLAESNADLELLYGPNEDKLRENGAAIVGASGEFVARDNTFLERVKDNDLGTLSLLIHEDLTFLTKMNVSIMHEMIRQRTVRQTYEPLRSALERNNRSFTVPEAMKERGYESTVLRNSTKLVMLYDELVELGVPWQDAIGVAPHSLEIYSVLKVDGWNLFHLSEKRLCGAAKPGMREVLGNMKSAAVEHDPWLRSVMVPQGQFYGACTEPGLYQKCRRCKLPQ